LLVHLLDIAARSLVSISGDSQKPITTKWRIKRMSKNNKPVGIVVHINEKLEHDQISMLETSLGSDAGVKEARINRRRSHLMLVDYMPGVITARQVLNYINNKGYSAVLVGGI
jgi:hypothetical protein